MTPQRENPRLRPPGVLSLNWRLTHLVGRFLEVVALRPSHAPRCVALARPLRLAWRPAWLQGGLTVRALSGEVKYLSQVIFE